LTKGGKRDYYQFISNEKESDMIELGSKTAKHLYEIGTDNGRIEVHAHNRSQAERIAEKAGYVVRDVNMVG
jgi:hypothetical protein